MRPIANDECHAPRRSGGIPVASDGCGPKAIVHAPPAFITDALMRGKLVWLDHLSAGYAQSLGNTSSLVNHKFGRYRDRSPDSSFRYSPTGGRIGGGYLEALVDAYLDTFLFDFEEAPLSGDSVGTTNQNGLITLVDLNGATISEPKALQRFGEHSSIYVNPDYTLQAYRWNEGNIWTPMGPASTNTVPPTGIFALESQVGATPVGCRVGGFVLARAYADDWPVEGKLMLRFLGSPASIVSTNFPFTPLIGMPAGSRLHGCGVIGPFGDVTQWQYDMSFAAAMAMADSQVGSIITYTHTEVLGTDLSFVPQTIESVLIWGQTERWRNVVSKDHSADEHVEPLTLRFPMGNLSPATGRWLVGPFVPPSPDVSTRNTLIDAAQEFYRVGLNVTAPIVEIVALGPFALYGARLIQGSYIGNFDGFVAPVVYRPYFFTGPGALPGDYPDGAGAAHHVFRLALKTRGGTTLLGRMGRAALDVTGFNPGLSVWRSFWGFQLNPPTLWHQDDAGQPWNPSSLPDVGLVNDFSKLDELIVGGFDPSLRWLQNDFGQAGLDVAIRTRKAPVTVFPPQPPLPDLLIGTDTNTTTGFLVVYDGSVDFNGSKDELITGVVTRVVHWGDGSGPTTITGPGPTHNVTHQYAGPGTYTVTLTVTNALGLTNTTTIEYVALGILTANLLVEIDGISDPTGKTADFTDLSTITLGTIVSRAWTFGDGGTSTATNPTHVYADYITYPVTLTVTDNLGRHSTATGTIEVTPPVIGGGGCGLTAAAKTSPATVNVQADDFAGGNARFINYLSSTNLRNYLVNATPYRALYDSSLARFDTSYRLDTIETFNGRPSLGFDIDGDFYGVMDSEFSNDTTNLGDDSDFSNSLVDEIWIRMIFKLNQLLIDRANLNNPMTPPGNGLQLVAIEGQSNYAPVLYGNNGHVYLDIYTRLTEGAASSRREVVDLGAVAEIGSKDWVEIVAYAKADEVAHTQRNMVWVGAACSLGGASPLADRTNAAFPFIIGSGQGQTFRDVVWMDYIDNSSVLFSDPKPGGNISLWEIHRVPLLTNPFGVALT